MWEFLEFAGWWSLGRPANYFARVENFHDWFMAIVPAMLWYFPTNRFLLVGTILLSWMRLTQVASLCEPIGRALMPFTKLLWGLGPVLFIANVAFGAWAHAFFFLQKGSLKSSMYGSYVTLITAGLPGALDEDPLEASLLLIAVTIFTVVVLNIFIGVIGEEYSRLQQDSPQLFKQERAQMCRRAQRRYMRCCNCF